MSRDKSILEYVPDNGASCLHFLHGHVPGRHLDWILRPVGTGGLSSRHVSRMSEFVDDIEPLAGHPFTLAIVNLAYGERSPSEFPVGILVGFRLSGFSDDAGRSRVRFYYALAAREGRWSEERYLANVSAVLAVLTGSAFGTNRDVSRADAFYGGYRACVLGVDEQAGRRVIAEIRQIERHLDTELVRGRPHFQLEESVESIAVLGGDDSTETVIRSMCGLASVLSNSDAEWRGLYFGQSGARRCHTVAFSSQESLPYANTRVSLKDVQNLDGWVDLLKAVRGSTQEEKVFGNPYLEEPEAQREEPALQRTHPIVRDEPSAGARPTAEVEEEDKSRVEVRPDEPRVEDLSPTLPEDRGDRTGGPAPPPRRRLPRARRGAQGSPLNSIVVLVGEVRSLKSEIRDLARAIRDGEVQGRQTQGRTSAGHARASAEPGAGSKAADGDKVGRGAFRRMGTLLRRVVCSPIFVILLVMATTFWLALR